jgi:Protein of unknown function (DUF3352)
MRATICAMRALSALALACLTLVAAGCGASSPTGLASAANLGAAAAQLVPPDALALVSVDTDQSSQQWQHLDALTRGLAARDELLQKLRGALARRGLEYDRDVKPAVGSELDLAVLKIENGTAEAIALTKPDEESKLRALASKFDQGSEHYTVQQIGDWSIVADSADAFAAVRSAESRRSLADTNEYAAARAQLDGNTLARAYVARGALASLPADAKSLLGGASPAWTAAKVDVGSDTVHASAAVAGDVGPAPYSSTLLRDVPSGAILALSFKNAAGLVRQLTVLNAGSLPLRQLAPLLTGEGVVYVRPAGIVPEVAVELAPADPRAALVRARSILSSAAGALGPLKLSARLSAGKLVISDSPAAVDSLRGGPKLVDDPTFRHALEAAGTPPRTGGLVYADVAQLAPFLQLVAQATGGETVDPALTDTLSDVGALVAWASRAGGVSHFDLWAQRR